MFVIEALIQSVQVTMNRRYRVNSKSLLKNDYLSKLNSDLKLLPKCNIGCTLSIIMNQIFLVFKR